MEDAAKQQIALMARYHAWATKGLLASVSTIPDDKYRKPCGIFFGSIHGTLNHLLLTEGSIWFPRFVQGEIASLPLDAEVDDNRERLGARLIDIASGWSGHIEKLQPEALAGDLHYTMTNGQDRRLPMFAALLHVFNHATHHRAQVTAAITMHGFDFEPLDLPYLVFADQRNSEAGNKV